MANEMDRVVPLDDLDDFRVADGDPDVRGWEVVASDGRKIGEVDELLVDTGAMKVRYLDVDLDDEVLQAGQNRHVLIPIGYARLDENDDRIFVDELDSARLAALPEYTHQPITREYESTLRGNLDTGYVAGAAAATTTRDDDFYAHEAYDENRFYGARRGQTEGVAEGERRLTLSEEELDIQRQRQRAGEVEINKEVETRHVRENVPVRHEEVVVERRPATSMSGEARIEGDEIRVPVNEEELVVQKRTVPREELVVKKREVIENETVEADLRRERADIHREGDVDIRDR